MANYSTLKTAVADVVKTNGNQAITGANLQSVLLSIINSVGGGGYIFKGVATPSTNAGTPDQNVFYIGGAGTYSNFGTSITVPVGSICVFKYNGSWTKETLSDGLVERLDERVDDLALKVQELLLEERKYAITSTTWGGSSYTHYVIPVNGGEKVSFDNVAGTMYCAFLKSYITPVDGATPDFCDNFTGRQMYYESTGFTTPSDCRFLIINNPTGDWLLSSLKINGIETINGVHGAISDAGKQIVQTNERFYETDTGQITFTKGRKYTASVGNAPSYTADNTYYYGRIGGIVPGDVISVNARSGSSAPKYILLLNGICVATRSANSDTNWSIVADGLYDEIIINDYEAYVAHPSGTISRANLITDNLDARLTIVEGEINPTLKVLCLGNSFTQDSMAYVPFILKNIAPNVKLTLGIGFIGGSPLVQHLVNLTGVSETLKGQTYVVTNYTYYKSENGGNWTGVNDKSVDYLLADEDWDIITFQQSGGTSDGSWENYYAPYIYRTEKALFDKLSRNLNIGWISIHGSYGESDADFLDKWENTTAASKKVMELTGATILFPYGTAVQNLRTTTLKSLGYGSAHNLTYDNAHLQEGIGCLAAAYANALTMCNFLNIGVGLVGETTRVDVEYVTDHNVPSPHWIENGAPVVIGISDNNCFLAQIAAEKAVSNPYVLTYLNSFET